MTDLNKQKLEKEIFSNPDVLRQLEESEKEQTENGFSNYIEDETEFSIIVEEFKKEK